MEKTLNLNDGWESVVNNPERQEHIDRFHAERRERRLMKLGEKVSIFAIVAVFFFVSGLAGWLPAWISSPIGTAFTGLAFFNFGRYSQLKGW